MRSFAVLVGLPLASPDAYWWQRPAASRTNPPTVSLGQPVRVGDLVVTPNKLVEDSPCPANARCVWAGLVIVTSRIFRSGIADTADLTLGEPYLTNGRMLALVGVRS